MEGKDNRAYEQLKRSIDSLQRLYTIVVGLALTEAIRSFFGLNAGLSLSALKWADLPWVTLLVMVITLIPFYHGANAHLDRTYLFEPSAGTDRPFVLIVDFFVLFIEAIVFLVMAALLRDLPKFVAAFQSLLLLDMLWGCIVYFSLAGPAVPRHVKWWLIINVLAVIGMFLTHNTPLIYETARWKAMLGVAVLRTGLDYLTCWDFYMARYPLAESRK